MANKYLLNVYQNDVGYKIFITLKDFNNAPVNLSTATGAVFSAQLIDTINQKIGVTGAMVIEDAINGVVSYLIQGGDFASAGIYDAQVKVGFPGGEVIRFGEISIACRPQLPIS